MTIITLVVDKVLASWELVKKLVKKQLN